MPENKDSFHGLDATTIHPPPRLRGESEKIGTMGPDVTDASVIETLYGENEKPRSSRIIIYTYFSSILFSSFFPLFLRSPFSIRPSVRSLAARNARRFVPLRREQRDERRYSPFCSPFLPRFAKDLFSARKPLPFFLPLTNNELGEWPTVLFSAFLYAQFGKRELHRLVGGSRELRTSTGRP